MARPKQMHKGKSDDDDDGRVDGATEGPASVPRTEASLLPAETTLTRTEGSLLHPLVSYGIQPFPFCFALYPTPLDGCAAFHPGGKHC